MESTARTLSLLALASVLFAVTAGAQTEDAPMPGKWRESRHPGNTPPSAETIAADRLSDMVLNSIATLDSTGKRTSEAIAEYDATLTLGPLRDPNAFNIVCMNGGKPLLALAQTLVDNRGFRGKASNPHCGGDGDAASPFTLSFHVHHEGGQPGLFDESPVLLPLNVAAPDDDSDSEDRDVSEDTPPPGEVSPDYSQSGHVPLVLNPLRTQTSHATMTLPPGWQPDELPKPFHSDSPFATVDITVSFDDGKLVTDQKLVIKKEKIEVAAEREAFDKWIGSVITPATEPDIHLSSTLYFPSIAYSGTTDDQKKAAELMRQASGAIDGKDFAKAASLLHQAQALDPDHELLHDRLGDLAEAQGHYDNALKEFREELRAFPNVPLEMESIALLQRKMGRMEDAIQTLQAWMVTDPKSQFPPLDLMNFYHEMHRDDLAVGVGDQAMNTLPEDARRSVKLLTMYGREQMLTGQAQNAKVTLEKLLASTTDIQFVNDAAYYLSEQGASLDLAEATLRESLTQFDDDSSGESEHLDSMDKKQLTSLLFSSWDTLGWILFKEGRTTEGEAYIRAAWRGHQDPAIGRHLAEILVSREKPDEALDAYVLAAASVPGKDQAKFAKDPDMLAIRQAIERLQKEGHTSTIKDPAIALQQLHTIEVGPAEGHSGEQLYIMTLTSTQTLGFPSTYEPGKPFVDLSNLKIPSDFFPPESKASMTRDARLKCATTCILVFSEP